MQRITLSFIAVVAGSAVFLGAKTSAVEPDDVTFDGSVLTVPYVEVGELAYEVKLAPTTEICGLRPEWIEVMFLKIIIKLAQRGRIFGLHAAVWG